MRIAIVGCGYVADFYMGTLCNHPELIVVGFMDRIRSRAEAVCGFWKVGRVYDTLDELLADTGVEMVVNLTNPASHFEVTKASLLAGKHVYSEKPLAMVFRDAKELVELAEARGLRLSGAPCGILSETAQTVKRALEQREVGKVFLAYAEIDDGLMHKDRYRKWKNPSGGYWPYKDEFEVGCTLEHAGYWIAYLIWFFGPVTRLVAYSSVRVEDKQTDVPLEIMSPDYSVANLEFASGMVARLTCSIVAPHDRSLTIVGEDGTLIVEECWDYHAPVYINRPTKFRRWGLKYPLFKLLMPGVKPARLPLVPGPKIEMSQGVQASMDFSRGVAELAAAVRENRESKVSARFTLHVNEVAIAIQSPNFTRGPYVPVTSF